MIGRNKNIAREEYMVALGKKEPAAFAVYPESIELSDITADTQEVIHLAIAKDGYMEIEAYTADEFISLSRRVISSDIFPAGSYDFQINILENKLHRGKNFGKITFGTAYQEITVPVTVDLRLNTTLDDHNPRKKYIELTKVYFAFRKGLTDSVQWAQRSLKIIGEVNGVDDKSVFLMLFKAQLYIEIGLLEEADNILEYVSDLLPRLEADRVLEYYCSFVKTLADGDSSKTDEFVSLLRSEYQLHPSWQILWMLFQLDPNYDESPGLKLDDISAELDAGCTSSLMLLEALDIFRQYPRFLSDADEFEIKVLNLGAKMDYFSPTMSSRVTEIFKLMTEDDLKERNIPLSLNVLRYMYRKYPTRDLLRIICRVLIFTDDRSAEAGAYYDAAVKEYLDDIPGIFFYYIYTIDKNSYEALPVRIMEYFTVNVDVLLDHRRYFFANIIYNRQKRPEFYRAYEKAFNEYGARQLMAGAIDHDLAVIYMDMVASDSFTPEMKKRFFDVISTKEIKCHNEKMRNVMVFHDELNVYQDIPLKNKGARVKIYSHDAVILFKDITGNIYANIEYEKTELIKSDEYIDVCVKGVPISDYMLMGDTMPFLRGYKDPAEILEYMTTKMSTSAFRPGYVKKLMNDTVLYFSRNIGRGGVYEDLMEFFKYDLESATKGKLISIMIEQKLYRDAYKKIREEGIEYVDSANLGRLCEALCGLSNFNSDGLLMDMCVKSFMDDPRTGAVYKFLVDNYDEDIAVLLELYRVGRAFGADHGNIPETILRRAIETGMDEPVISQIFSSYYTEGGDEQLKKDYMTYRAGLYLRGDNEKDTEFFNYIEKALLGNEQLSIVSRAAYLKYKSERDISGVNRMRMVEHNIKELVASGIMLEEFKRYRKYFPLPAALSNSVIISSFKGPASIAFEIHTSKGAVLKEEMLTEVFEGCYTKYITLFYGESVTYSVDGGEIKGASYDELGIIHDGSRYSQLNNIVEMSETGNAVALNLAAKEYFIKDRLIERIFS